MNLASLSKLFASAGCQKLYAKPLAENDNSKNQVYFGPGFQALNLFPNRGIEADSKPTNQTFKAKITFGWLLANGKIADAPNAQLILYPQYPEVRFSGFLRGCTEAPSGLMASREQGRVLFLGVTKQQQVRGFVVAADSLIAREFQASSGAPREGVFHDVAMPNVVSVDLSRVRLLGELRRINRLGWIDSKQLDSRGMLKECNAPQCGGFTLEAELGIAKNSKSEPDYLGWEVKQHAVSNFDRVQAGTITLMTPQPTGGYYSENGPCAFVQKFGYADKRGRLDRMNFGGIHRVGRLNATTSLTMRINGFDTTKGQITDASGTIALVSEDQQVAASWPFSRVLEHWSRKHTKAVYVPSIMRKDASRQYCYGHKVRLAQRTDSLRLLSAFATGAVYYDPGIKLEGVSTGRPRLKERSQFRIASKFIDSLYETVDVVEL